MVAFLLKIHSGEFRAELTVHTDPPCVYKTEKASQSKGQAKEDVAKYAIQEKQVIEVLKNAWIKRLYQHGEQALQEPSPVTGNQPKLTQYDKLCSKLLRVSIDHKVLISMPAYCVKHSKVKPQVFHELVAPEVYKVWIIMETLKFQLNQTFPDIVTGQEKLAKRVLKYLVRSSRLWIS